MITEMFQRHGLCRIILDFEKVYETFLLESKKRYAVYKHLFDIKTNKLVGELSSSGMETVRRDVPLFLTHTLKTLIQLVVQDRNLDKGIRFVQEEFSKLKEGNVPLDNLIITGSFSKRADQYAGKVPHIEAVRRQMMRDPNKAPTVGSRIDWVIVKISEDAMVNAGAKVYEQSEMPSFVLETGAELDYEKYFNKCTGAICRFLAPALAPQMSVKEGEAYVRRRVFDDYFREQDRLKKIQNSSIIRAFAKQKLYAPKNRNAKLFARYDKRKREEMSETQKKRKMNRALAQIHSSCGMNAKRKREEVKAREQNGELYTQEMLSTSCANLDDWMAETGTDKKGRRYKG